MYYSIIDVGSNTVKLCVYCVEDDRIKKVYFEPRAVGLISYVFDGILSKEGEELLCKTLSEMKSKACEYSAQNIHAFATASLRGLSNARRIIEKIYDESGVFVEVISAESEAQLSLYGLLLEGRGDSGVMLDMGGGSTEAVLFKEGRAVELYSFNFGCLSLYKRFVKEIIPTDKERENIAEFVEKTISAKPFIKNTHLPLFLVGGTAHAAGVLGGSEDGEIAPQTFLDVCILTEERLDSLVPTRKTTVIPGCVAYSKLVDYISPSKIYISQSGVREGYLMKILGKIL